MIIEDPFLLLAVGFVAFLYSSVGHAGASGYIAVFALAGWSPVQIRPLALMLNVVVASVATIRFYRAGYFRPSLFKPIALFSVPAAAIGGYVKITAVALSQVIGMALLLSALWLLVKKREPEQVNPPSSVVAMLTGAGIGFFAGLSGTGGGIFLSPLMVHLRWGKLKEISAIAAPYILLNSLAGLSGMSIGGLTILHGWWEYVIVVAAGGVAGSSLGAGIVPTRVIQRLLALVLLIAATKLILLKG